MDLDEAERSRFLSVLNGYIHFQALATACDLDLFTHLAAHPGATLDELRGRLGLQRHAARVLLLACCAAGLVERDPSGRYSNGGIASKVLVSGAEGSMVPFVKFSHAVQMRCCYHLTRSLRENRAAGLDEFPGEGTTLYERLATRPELELMFHEAMGAYTRQSTRGVDAPEFASVGHLLDVGGGDGSNAERLCAMYPGLRVTVLDKPSVCAIARERIAARGLADRVRFVEGDMFSDPWPAGCDGVFMSHLLEIFSEEKVVALYRKAFESLPPGGRVFVWTIAADDHEVGGLQAAKSSIYFVSTASGEGMAYPCSDHERFMREVGFVGVTRYDARDIDHGALVATVPARPPAPEE